jgi:HNH endonuclease
MNKPYSTQEVEVMRSMYENGNSLQSISDATGRSIFGIYYRLKKLGVVMRAAKPLARRGGRKAGFSHTEESRRKMSEIAKSRGPNHNWFVDGRGKERDSNRKREMDRFEYKMWREKVFNRDSFTCVSCNQVGGILNADHIVPWSINSSLRYCVENGRTLCTQCHKKTPTYGKNISSQVAAF